MDKFLNFIVGLIFISFVVIIMGILGIYIDFVPMNNNLLVEGVVSLFSVFILVVMIIGLIVTIGDLGKDVRKIIKGFRRN